MKPLSKIISAIVVILLTTFCIDSLFAVATEKIFVNHELTKFQYAISSEENYDWLILGSSRAARHYDCNIIEDSLGIKVFNLGKDGRGITYHDAVLKTYFERHKADVIILDLLVDDLSGSLNNRVKALYPYIDRYNSIREVAECIDSRNNWLLRSHLVRYNSEIFQLSKSIINPYRNLDDGYEPLEPKTNLVLDEETVAEPSIVDATAKQCFLDIVELCKNHKTKLIVAFSPELINRTYDLEISQICDSLNIPLIDSRNFRLSSPPSTYFNDLTHLNKIGAKEYTKNFIKQMQNHME